MSEQERFLCNVCFAPVTEWDLRGRCMACSGLQREVDGLIECAFNADAEAETYKARAEAAELKLALLREKLHALPRYGFNPEGDFVVWADVEAVLRGDDQ